MVRQHARRGADRETIVAAMGIAPERLADPDVLDRLQREMARGAALHKLDLLADVERLRKGGDGSVNATIASLRQALGWDRPDSGKSRDRQKPDDEAAVAELERTLRRFRAPR